MDHPLRLASPPLPLATSPVGVRYQHTMLTPLLRWSAMVVACTLIACGGSGDGGGGGGACMDGTKSTPGAAGDPCAPQTGTTCGAMGGQLIACCAGTSWQMSAGKVVCRCNKPTDVTCGTGMCGNGVIDTAAGEQCDGMMLGTTNTCMAMGMGMGMLGCDPTTCRYDTSMCTGSGPTGGTGGGGTGGS